MFTEYGHIWKKKKKIMQSGSHEIIGDIVPMASGDLSTWGNRSIFVENKFKNSDPGHHFGRPHFLYHHFVQSSELEEDPPNEWYRSNGLSNTSLGNRIECSDH